MEVLDLSHIEVDETINVHDEKRCPICSKEMDYVILFAIVEKFSCPNSCYMFKIHPPGTTAYYVFDFHADHYEVDKVRKLIQYYKENDRYLAEILTRN